MNKRLAIDFGTSNSAVAVLNGDQVKPLMMDQGADTIPTAIFFDFEEKEILFGAEATRYLIEGASGRYMRSLKSVLGSSLMKERRLIMGRYFDFYDIISIFLSALKARAEALEGRKFESVLSGRPVHFHDDAIRDKQALLDLKECYVRAGFRHVDFMFEPEAAAVASTAFGQKDSSANALGLIVDIGGGTSDYTLFQRAKNTNPQHNQLDILASHGIRLGGTHFDKQLSLRHFMPFLGKDSTLRRPMAEGTLEAPIGLFSDLATWETIPLLYTPQTLYEIKDYEHLAINPTLFRRLRNLIENRRGHELAFTAERAKIAANDAKDISTIVNLDLIEANLSCAISGNDLIDLMKNAQQKITQAALETLKKGNSAPESVTDVIFVGGSSLMGFVRTSMQQIFPTANFHTSAVFTAVVDGLARATASNK
ncbi:MAG: hsp70 family protein [Hyphomicrobiales bacterium]|nr:MAG: hsp70 family protein [Hyphomicrobiales bacterium]